MSILYHEIAELPRPDRLVYKLRASDLASTHADAASVIAWEDANGILANHIAGTAPTFRTNVLGGMPSVRFTNGSLRINNPGALKTAVDSLSYTVLIVSRNITGSGANGFDTIFAASAGGNSFFYFSDGVEADRYGGNTNFSVLTNGQTFNTMGTIAGPMNEFLGAGAGINSEMFMRNGTSYRTQALTPVGTGGNPFTLGALGSTTGTSNIFTWNGDLFEIYVWDVPLTPAEYMRAEMLVRDRYSLPYPWTAFGRMPVFFGDSISAGVGASSLATSANFIAAARFGLTYGQYQVLAVGGLTMDQLTKLVPAYVNPIADIVGGMFDVAVFEWANQRDTTTTKGALLLAALKAGSPNIKTVFGTSTSLSTDPHVDRATYNAAWDAVWAGARTNIDAYMPIHLNTRIGVNGSYTTYSSAGDGVHLPDVTQPDLADEWVKGFLSLGQPYAAAAPTTKTLTADPGSYTLTGTAATLAKSSIKILIADPGSYALTGTAATLKVARKVVAGTSSYTLTGTAANLTKSAFKTLAAGASSYTLTGATTTVLRLGRKAVAAPGSYTLTGSAATLRWAHKVVAVPGSYALTGTAATLKVARKLLATTPGSYALTGSSANLLKAGQKALSADAGSYALTPATTATLRWTHKIVGASSSYALTGTAATLVRVKTLTAAAGSYTLTGQPATLKWTHKLVASPGSYALTGYDAVLLKTGSQGLFASLYVDPDTFFGATVVLYPPELYDGFTMYVPPELRAMATSVEHQAMAVSVELRTMRLSRRE